MRLFSLLVALALFVGVAVAQEEGPSHESVGTVNDVMRSIFLTNSNIVFDVQRFDPGALGETATERYGSLYSGWQVVEAAATALAEGANLLVLPGRFCENGQPAPVDQPDWIRFSRQMEEAGRLAFEAAKTRDQATVAAVTAELDAACSACHRVYQDALGGLPDRCKVP